jgi:YidC/Oxa1 family membrane protein insertase
MLAFAPFDAAVGVAHTAVDALAVLLTPVAGGLAGALAIVAFTIAVRLLISPLSYIQVRGERRRAALAPRLAELRAKHRNDPQRLATEILALQREADTGPLAGCLPALLQAPFFMVMYRLVTVPAVGSSRWLRAGELFGVPLTAHLPAGPFVFAGLLVIAAVLAWWSSRRLHRARAAEPAVEGRAAAVVGPLTTLLPYTTVMVVAFMPLAGGIYVLTSAAWTALEHAFWRRPAAAVHVR